MFGPSATHPSRGLDRSTLRYLGAVVVLVVAITSQYFVPQSWPASRPVYTSLLGDVVVVYGLPIVAFVGLVGPGPLRGWRSAPQRAAVVGPAWYGAMGALALVILLGMIAVYSVVDPAALQLLNKENPALTAAAGNPWFFVGFSFVVGAFEETIFRGWVFGFWLRRTPSWLAPAILSSGLFAAVHLYYGTTYGAASPLIFPTLFLTGFAFAATYRSTGGNLVVIAVLHGANDAFAYLTLVSTAAGTVLHFLLIGVGCVLAVVYYAIWSGRTGGVPPPVPPP